ncbi:MAG: lysophospholipid acyltransferase family protein [Chitinophagaceae bacterium]|nr:lysophospholipid acyltransferase family protein [Chitinophagaceae bacterium]
MLYYFVFGLFWLLSLLPLRLLYVISDFMSVVLFYVVQYRKKVVLQNLQLAFPEKTEKERRRIAWKFYRNLTDTFFETIKLLSASKKFVLKRFAGNWELVNEEVVSGKNIYIFLGHHFNWEWANIASANQFRLPFLAVYMPVANALFDRLIAGIRKKSGTLLLRATHMALDYIPYRNQQNIVAFIADQNPGHPQNAYWFSFFGKPAPFIKTPSKSAVKNQHIVFFAKIVSPERGKYEVIFTRAKDTSNSPEKLAAEYVRYLESAIRQQPDNWLWSHRRWKREWKPEYGPVLVTD